MTGEPRKITLLSGTYQVGLPYMDHEGTIYSVVLAEDTLPPPALVMPDYDKIIAAAVRASLRPMLAIWEGDPHRFSERPCRTCQSITIAAGFDFGCVAYANSPERRQLGGWLSHG